MTQETFFCYLDIRCIYDEFIVGLCISVTVFLLSYCLIADKRSERTSRITSQLKLIFKFIFTWGIIYITQFTFGILIYQFSLKNNTDYLTISSKIIASIDSIPSFILEGLLILIPYNMIKQIENIQNQRYSAYIPDQDERKLLKKLKYYQYIRCIKLLHCGLLFIPLDVEIIQKIQIIGLLLIILDSAICALLLYYSRKIIFRKNILKLSMEKSQFHKLKLELLVLNIVSWFRCIADIGFLLVPLIFSSQSCEQLKQKTWNSIGYLLIGQFFIHFIPIFLIIRFHLLPEKYLKRSLFS